MNTKTLLAIKKNQSYANDLYEVTTYEDMDRLFNNIYRDTVQMKGKNSIPTNMSNSSQQQTFNKASQKYVSNKGKWIASAPTSPKNSKENANFVQKREMTPSNNKNKVSWPTEALLTSVRGNPGEAAPTEEFNTQFLRENGLNIAVYNSLKTQEEKDAFVVQSMRANFQEDFTEFIKKHNAKLAQAKSFEKEFKKEKQKSKKDKVDIFKWLNVQTPFEPLKKKLRVKLIETINEPETQNKLVTPQGASLLQSKNNDSMITIDNVQSVNNSITLQKMLDDNRGIIKLAPAKRKFRFQQHNLSVPKLEDYFESPKNEEIDIVNKNQNLPVRRKSLDLSPKVEGEERIEQSATERGMKEPLFQWDRSKESIFQISRENAKKFLSKKVRSSSWNHLGFSTFIQASQKEEKIKLQSDKKLERYMSGDLLSAEDYKLIANSSVLLNEYVDKKFFQSVVNKLDPELLETLEVGLAEDIISNYHDVKQNIQKGRNAFLKEKNKKTVTVIDKTNDKFQKMLKYRQSFEERKKIKEKIVNMLSKIEKKKAQEATPELKKIKIDLKFFTNKLLKPIEDKIEARKMKENEEFLNNLTKIKHKSTLINIEESKRTHHPPSKILLPSSKEHSDFMGLETSALVPKTARRNEPIEDYKLNLHPPPSARISQNFKRFYSGGPVDEDQMIFQGHFVYGDVSKYHVNEAQKKVIIKIQALWRGHAQRKAFKLLRRKARDKKRIAERMSYLKDKSASRFLRAVLAVQEKFGHLQIDTDLENANDGKTKASSLRPQTTRNGTTTYTQGTQPPQFFLSKFTTPKARTNTTSSSRLITSNVPLIPNFDKKDQIKESTLDQVDSLSAKSPKTVKSQQISAKGVTASTFPTLAQIVAKRKEEQPHIPVETQTMVFRTKSAVKTPKNTLLIKHGKLFNAAKTNNFDIIIRSGFQYYEADVNKKDQDENVPLYYAARNGNKEICEFLLQHGAKVNEPCEGGNTPLHMAFSSNQVMIVILLISKGGNLNVLNHNGQTPVAFGSETLLSMLNLKNAVATFERSPFDKYSEYDNNKFLQKPVGKDKIPNEVLRFDYINRKSSNVHLNPKGLQFLSEKAEKK